MGVTMKRVSALSVCFVGLLQVGLGLAEECAGLPGDSISRFECERGQKRPEPPKRLPAQVIGGSGPRQGDRAGYRPWPAEEAPPFRKQGAEPLITIFLTSGNTIRVDKTWVKGDRLIYFSRGFRGSVPLMDVNRLEDLRVKLRLSHAQ